MERMFDWIEEEAPYHQQELAKAKAKLADYLPRLGGPFPYQADLAAKVEELRLLDRDLAATAAVEDEVSA
jgi:hypothetical protein